MEDNMKSSLWFRLFVGVLAVALIFLAFQQLPVRDWIGALLAWIQTLGPAAPVILILVYIIACVMLIPGSLITLGAGFLFGLGKGFIVVSIGSVVGATIAFLIGRTLARDWISERVNKKPKFQAVDEAVGQRGFYIVLLTRLSPVFPFTLLNYFYGITAVSMRDYVLASWIGMIPGTLMYVYFGSIVKNLTELVAGEASTGTGGTILFWFGLVATVAVAVMVTRIARRALNEVIAKKSVAPDHLGEDGSHA
jgi:uncharacterized membrane protein YdjX (TVP38/TMEM64 family)